MNIVTNMIGAVFLLSGYCACGQYNYSLFEDHVIKIHGSSNIRDWTESVQKASGGASISWNNDGSFDLNASSLVMVVQSIKSKKGSVMDEKTHKALKSEKYPVIEFALTTPLRSVLAYANGYAVTASGNLSIAGVTRPVQIRVKLFTTGRRRIVAEGSCQINMLDYGIDPPAALFGMLKVTEDITIQFRGLFIANDYY
ncbi:YceI family protein [Compostibacter hankyongensis]|uniref:Lipid/polyisoprenoid-binding YceI-like domain-containing protein n=1 Tax=Compostibacter hankyongensis TaxID=1007089 RepID=A0ABP8FWK5_9BACT